MTMPINYLLKPKPYKPPRQKRATPQKQTPVLGRVPSKVSLQILAAIGLYPGINRTQIANLLDRSPASVTSFMTILTKNGYATNLLAQRRKGYVCSPKGLDFLRAQGYPVRPDQTPLKNSKKRFGPDPDPTHYPDNPPKRKRGRPSVGGRAKRGGVLQEIDPLLQALSLPSPTGHLARARERALEVRKAKKLQREAIKATITPLELQSLPETSPENTQTSNQKPE